MKRRTTVIALAAAALAAGCSNGGGSASRHYTLRSVSHCLRAQGAQVLDAQDPNYQDDPDAMAIGAIKVLRARGLCVPEDVSVIGFDDIEFAQYVEPPLTTIHQPRREIGRAAMQKMIAKLANKNEKVGQVVLMHELILRSSTARYRQR